MINLEQWLLDLPVVISVFFFLVIPALIKLLESVGLIELPSFYKGRYFIHPYSFRYPIFNLFRLGFLLFLAGFCFPELSYLLFYKMGSFLTIILVKLVTLFAGGPVFLLKSFNVLIFVYIFYVFCLLLMSSQTKPLITKRPMRSIEWTKLSVLASNKGWWSIRKELTPAMQEFLLVFLLAFFFYFGYQLMPLNDMSLVFNLPVINLVSEAPDLFFTSLGYSSPRISWLIVSNTLLTGIFATVLVRWPFWPNKFLVNFELLLVTFTVFMSLFFISFNLMASFVCLEGFSFALYALAASGVRSHSSVEAAIKYFCLGSVSSGLFLYGVSLLYGLAGSLNFFLIRSYLLNFVDSGLKLAYPPFILYLATWLLVFGFLFKLSAFPCHFWTPDVYEGAPTPVTAIFATFAKLGVFLFFLKFLLATFFCVPEFFTTLMVISAVGSLIIGCLGALVQKKIKRFIAYTSINQMGFLLMGISCGTFYGAWSSFLYLQIYYVMSLAFFSFLFCFWVKKSGDPIEDLFNKSHELPGQGNQFKLSNTKRELHSLYDFTGLFGIHNCKNIGGFLFNPQYQVEGSRLAFLATITLFSMAGIPPLGGFFSKYYVLVAVSESSNYLLVIFGLFVNVISAFYYIKIINRIWFTKPRVFSCGYVASRSSKAREFLDNRLLPYPLFGNVSLELLSLWLCVIFLILVPFMLEDLSKFSASFVFANVHPYCEFAYFN